MNGYQFFFLSEVLTMIKSAEKRRRTTGRLNIRQGGALLLLVVLSATSLSLAQPPGADRPAWEGVWRGWAVEGKGEGEATRRMHLELRITPDSIVATQLRLSGQPLRSLGEGTFKLRKKGTAWEIDTTRTSEPGRGQTYLGIWSLEGDALKWCSGHAGKARPREFESRPHDQYLLILKRQGS